MKGEILSIDTAEKLEKIKKINNKILEEISNCCEDCKSHECCPEEKCAIFNIEKLINQNYDLN